MKETLIAFSQHAKTHRGPVTLDLKRHFPSLIGCMIWTLTPNHFNFILPGVGYGMVQVPTVAPLLMYFTNKFGLANGISAAGAAVGMTVLPPLTEYWIQQYSWRGASIILGVINLHTTVAGALMRPPSSCKDKSSYSLLFGNDDEEAAQISLTKYVRPIKQFALMIKDRLSLGVFLKHPRFMLYQFIFLLAGIQFAGWHVFLVPNALSQDVNSVDAAFLASIGGLGNFIGRGFNGPLLDHHIFSDSMLFVLDHLICAIALLFDPLAHEYATMGILAFWAGLTIGCSYALCVVIAKNLAEEEKYIMPAVGWTHFSMGFGALIGGPLVGKNALTKDIKKKDFFSLNSTIFCMKWVSFYSTYYLWSPDLKRYKANSYHLIWLINELQCLSLHLKTIAVNNVTNRWRNHNHKTTKISELNKIIELYEL